MPHSFENRRVSISEVSSCVTSEDGCGRAVPYLQNDSAGDFQHSKQCKYEEKYLSKFSNVHKRKQTSLLAKVNSRCFFLFSGPTWQEYPTEPLLRLSAPRAEFLLAGNLNRELKSWLGIYPKRISYCDFCLNVVPGWKQQLSLPH